VTISIVDLEAAGARGWRRKKQPSAAGCCARPRASRRLPMSAPWPAAP